MCGWSLGRIEIDFDQNVPGRTRGSRTAGTGDQIQDSRERIVRKDFKTLHDIPEHAFCKTKKGKGGFGRFHADPADGPIGNGGDKTQDCGGDDTERPFRADQQLLYVIAAVVLLERIQAMMNTADWQQERMSTRLNYRHQCEQCMTVSD